MWEIYYSKEAKKFLEDCDKGVNEFIILKLMNLLDWLNGNIKLHTDIKSLKGKWAGYHRIRVGSVRIIIRFDKRNHHIIVHEIGYRGDIYK